MSAAVLRILPKPRGRQPSSSPAVLNLYPNYRSGLHFIYAIGFAGGVVKIGRSRNPRERLRQHWSKVEGQVQWIHLFEGGTKHYAYLVEAGAADAMRGFARQINRSEWFYADDKVAVIAAIRALIRPAKVSAAAFARANYERDQRYALSQRLLAEHDAAAKGAPAIPEPAKAA